MLSLFLTVYLRFSGEKQEEFPDLLARLPKFLTQLSFHSQGEPCLVIYLKHELFNILKWIKMLKINNRIMQFSRCVFYWFIFKCSWDGWTSCLSISPWHLKGSFLLRLNDIQQCWHFRQLSEHSTRRNKESRKRVGCLLFCFYCAWIERSIEVFSPQLLSISWPKLPLPLSLLFFSLL